MEMGRATAARGTKNCRPKAAGARRGRELVSFCVARLFSQSLCNSDDLQQRLAAFAVIGQDNESMPITAAVHNFIREQEVPFVQPVRHIQRLDRQFLRLADGTAPGLEHG
jgi:hypothetical protein